MHSIKGNQVPCFAYASRSEDDQENNEEECRNRNIWYQESSQKVTTLENAADLARVQAHENVERWLRHNHPSTRNKCAHNRKRHGRQHYRRPMGLQDFPSSPGPTATSDV